MRVFCYRCGARATPMRNVLLIEWLLVASLRVATFSVPRGMIPRGVGAYGTDEIATDYRRSNSTSTIKMRPWSVVTLPAIA